MNHTPSNDARAQQNLRDFAAWYKAQTGYPIGDAVAAWSKFVGKSDWDRLGRLCRNWGRRNPGKTPTLGQLEREYWQERDADHERAGQWWSAPHQHCQHCQGAGELWHVISTAPYPALITQPTAEWAGAYHMGLLECVEGPCYCREGVQSRWRRWLRFAQWGVPHRWQAEIRMQACRWLWILEQPETRWPLASSGQRECAPWEPGPNLSAWVQGLAKIDQSGRCMMLLQEAYGGFDEHGPQRLSTPTVDEWAKYGLGPAAQSRQLTEAGR